MSISSLDTIRHTKLLISHTSRHCCSSSKHHLIKVQRNETSTHVRTLSPWELSSCFGEEGCSSACPPIRGCVAGERLGPRGPGVLEGLPQKACWTNPTHTAWREAMERGERLRAVKRCRNTREKEREEGDFI